MEHDSFQRNDGEYVYDVELQFLKNKKDFLINYKFRWQIILPYTHTRTHTYKTQVKKKGFIVMSLKQYNLN